MTTTRDTYDLIVIGGGPAGLAAATHATRYGASILLIEQSRLGGVCVNGGCVPTRTLARAARLKRDSELFGEFGIDGGVTAVDWDRALARARASMDRVRENKYAVDSAHFPNVDFVVGEGPAWFSGSRQVTVAGRTIEGGKLVICAGGRARRLPIAGAELALSHSHIWTLTSLPQSVIIVGAASTGCQLASILEAFGVHVTILDVASRILASEDNDVSDAIAASFKERGIEVLTGIGGVDSLERATGGVRVTLSSGGRPLVRDVGAIIFAAGWTGSLAALNLSAAGIEIDRGFIRGDDELKTTNPDVYVAGDVDGHMMLVQSAEIEARLAVENALAGRSTPHRLSESHQIVPHGGFTDPEYASVGLTEEQVPNDGTFAVVRVNYEQLDRALIDGRTAGFAKLIISKADHTIAGAHVVGEQAVEAIHVAAAAMSAGLPVEAVAAIQFAYPTFTACIGLAAREAERLLTVQTP